MRKFLNSDTKELEKVICNQCKKELKVKNGILMEGGFHGEITFGYFSNKDGKKHSFDLCEECYDKMIEGFAIPVEEEEITEMI